MKLSALVSIDVVKGSEDLAEHALAHCAPLSLWASETGGPIWLVACGAIVIGRVVAVTA